MPSSMDQRSKVGALIQEEAMAKRRSEPLAVQTALFCDSDRRTVKWDCIPEPQRRRVVECLAQLLRESVDSDASVKREADDE